MFGVSLALSSNLVLGDEYESIATGLLSDECNSTCVFSKLNHNNVRAVAKYFGCNESFIGDIIFTGKNQPACDTITAIINLSNTDDTEEVLEQFIELENTIIENSRIEKK